MKATTFFSIVILNIVFSQAQTNNSIEDKAIYNEFSNVISISSNANVMAVSVDYKGDESGSVSVYNVESDDWAQIGDDILGEASKDFFGSSISLSSDGSILAVGAPGNDGVNGLDSGSVRIFKNIAGNWFQVGDDIEGDNAGDRLGESISLSSDGKILVVSSFLNDDATRYKLRTYKYEAGTWKQIEEATTEETTIYEYDDSSCFSFLGFNFSNKNSDR